MIDAGDYGPPPSSDECRKCSERPGRGVSWVDQGVIFWKCDLCGHTQHEGVLEEVNRDQIAKLALMDRSKDNQTRFMQEKWAKIDETRRSAKERPGENIVKEMWDDAEILYHDTEEKGRSDGLAMAKDMTDRIHALQ
jgi:hypothetical protein